MERDVVQPDYGVHGRANLVTHTGQEGGLGNVGLACLVKGGSQAIVLFDLLALNFGRIALQQDKKICAGVNSVKVQPLVENFAADIASDIDDVRLGSLELGANRRQLEGVDKSFLGVVVADKHREHLIFKIFVVNAVARRGED